MTAFEVRKAKEAARLHYHNPGVGVLEFDEDYARTKALERLLARYRKNGDLQSRIIRNHLIVLANVFPAESIPILARAIAEEFHRELAAFVPIPGVVPCGKVTEILKNETKN